MNDIRSFRCLWRDTARPFMFGPVDGMAAYPLVLFLFHIRFWTLAVALSMVVFIIVIGRFGYTPPVAFLAFRAWIGGRRVSRVHRLGYRRIWR